MLTKEETYKKQAMEAWNNLQKVHQIIYKELQKNFYDKGITTAQFDVLMELRKHKELPMRKIGELLAVTGGNVTGLIDRLEKKGLVTRERSDSDRRIIMARITKKGEGIFKKVVGEFEDNILVLLSGLGDGELDNFNSLLDKLQERLYEKFGAEPEEM